MAYGWSLCEGCRRVVHAPVIIVASITVGSSCDTISLVPLHKPSRCLIFRSSIIGVFIFSSNVYGGIPGNFNWFRYSIWYKPSKYDVCFPFGSIASVLLYILLYVLTDLRMIVLIESTTSLFGQTIAHTDRSFAVGALSKPDPYTKLMRHFSESCIGGINSEWGICIQELSRGSFGPGRPVVPLPTCSN